MAEGITSCETGTMRQLAKKTLDVLNEIKVIIEAQNALLQDIVENTEPEVDPET